MNRLKQFVTRLRRPDTREVAVAQVSDKYSEYPRICSVSSRRARMPSRALTSR